MDYKHLLKLDENDNLEEETTKCDLPWWLGPLGLNSNKIERKLSELRESFVPTTRTEFDQYIPYGLVSPFDCTSETALGLSKSFSQLLFGTGLFCTFEKTELEEIMKQVVDDFVLARFGECYRKDSFEFKGFPFTYPKGKIETECKDFYTKKMKFNVKEVFPRAVRDFYTSAYLFINLRGVKLFNLSTSGSFLCMSTMVDYCDAADDSGTGRQEAYEIAMGDGISKLMDPKFSTLLQELVTTSAFIKFKDFYTSHRIREFTEKQFLEIEKDRPAPKPEEFMRLRWWDAAVSPFFKAPLAFENGAGLTIDDQFAPTASSKCPHFRKALDNLIRYDELIDVNFDIPSKEPFNEIHIAGRYGGLKAVSGYADAVTAVIDEVAHCPCEIGGYAHDYALDVALGSCCWYMNMPRYRGFSQLVEVWESTDEKYQKLLRSSNHGSWITSEYNVLENMGGMLHDENWNPLWRMTRLQPSTRGDECKHCDLITDWITSRCLYRQHQGAKKQDIAKLVFSELHVKNDRTGKPWEKIFALIANGIPLSDVSIKDKFLAVVKTVWNVLAGIEDRTLTVEAAAELQWSISTDIDKALIASFAEKEGHQLRRLLMGMISCIFEKTNFSVYKRILDAAILNAGKQ